MQVNNITLSGKILSDPSNREVGKDKVVASFRIVHKASTSVFIDVDVWGKGSNVLPENIIKGKTVMIHGRLSQNNWVTRKGKKRSKHKITANKVIVVGNGKEEE